MTLFGYRLPGMSSLIVWALLWEAIGQSGYSFFVPPLSEVIATLIEVLPSAAFQKALHETSYAFAAGVFFAVLIGIPTGILMGKNRLVDELLLPWVNVFLSAPLTALVPVLMSHFWAVLIVLFALAFTISEILAHLERRLGYYAAKR